MKRVRWYWRCYVLRSEQYHGAPIAAGSVPTPPLRLRYMSSHRGMYPNMTGTLVSSKPLENSKVQSFGIPWLGIV